jgi:hypothetical protein
MLYSKTQIVFHSNTLYIITPFVKLEKIKRINCSLAVESFIFPPRTFIDLLSLSYENIRQIKRQASEPSEELCYYPEVYTPCKGDGK